MKTKKQGQSVMTPYKQKDFEIFLDYWFKLVKRVQSGKNKNRFRNTVTYIDINSGSGFNEKENVYGSPVIFCQKAKSLNVPYQAYCIEKEPRFIAELKQRTKDFQCRVFQNDNQVALPNIISNIPFGSLGLIYSDPNGIPDWKLLNDVSKHPNAKSIDILIRYNTGAVLRNHHNGYDINDFLEIEKEYWYIREYYPFDKWRWCFLCGMNYPYGDWKKEGWMRLDTSSGQKVIDRLTRKQEQKKWQLPLTGLIENI